MERGERNKMTFTYDPTTERGKVRLLIPDRSEASMFFSDAEIDTFLEIEEGIQRATALALETMASDQAMTLKVIRVLDLSTDGRSVSQALLERAAKLRSQAAEAEAAEDGGAFDIAEWTVSPFAEREIIWNEALRDG
jgi:hypothetical protein